MSFNIQHFRQVAAQPTDRVLDFEGRLQDAAHLEGSLGSHAVHVFRSASTENAAVIGEFREALRQAYGDGIAGQVTEAHLKDHVSTKLFGREQVAPLTSHDVRAVLRDADARLLHVALTGHADAEKVEAAVTRALSRADCPHPDVAPLYHQMLHDLLLPIAARVMAVDGTVDKELLTRIASQLAERLDDAMIGVLQAHLKDNPDGSVRQAVGDILARSRDRAEPLTTRFPGLAHTVDGLRNIGEGVCDMLERAQSDRAAIGTHFFNVPDAGPVTDIKITDSDPHKGGRKVAILTFGDHGKVVYKPRDVGIDAKLVGDTGQPGAQRSVAELVSSLLPVGHALPTNKFLQCQDAHHDPYGYVACFPNARRADALLTHDQACDFYREFGRQTAALMLFGTTDLHHGNIMVSEHRPRFTDLEISVDPEALRHQTPAHVAQGKGADGLDMTMIDKAISSTSSREYRAGARIEGDRLVLQDDNVSSAATENFVAVEDADHPLRTNRDNPPVSRDYAAFAREGFEEVLAAMHAYSRDHAAEMGQFVDSMRGMTVRYHPVPTEQHLDVLRIPKTIGLSDADGGVTTMQFMGGVKRTATMATQAEHRPAGDREPLDRLAASMNADYARGDVPYFTRRLGDQTGDDARRVFHNNVEVAGGDYFQTRPLEMLRGNLTALGTDDVYYAKLRADCAGRLEELFQRAPVGVDQEHLAEYQRILASG